MKSEYENFFEESVLMLEMAIVENDITSSKSNDLSEIISEIVAQYPNEFNVKLHQELLKKSEDLVRTYLELNPNEDE